MLENLVLGKEGLSLTVKGAGKVSYDYFWLRDNSRDAESFDSRSHQREIFTAGIDPEITPEHAHISDSGDELVINWPDLGAESRYAADFLAALSKPAESAAMPDPVTWNAASLDEKAVNMHFETVESDAGLAGMLECIVTHGFVHLHGAPKSVDSVRKVAERIGYVRQTIFGGLFEFEANEGMADSAYTPKELRPHTDGTYSHDAPGLQLLLCTSYDARGGESIMVDGAYVDEVMRREAPEVREDMTRIGVTGIYMGDGVVLRACRPMLRCDDAGRLVQVSFNNYDRDSVRLPDSEMRRLYECIRAFDSRVNDPANQWRRTLAPGEMLVFDNWRVLHGRAAFQGRRSMAGAYVNREDFESRLREFAIIE